MTACSCDTWSILQMTLRLDKKRCGVRTARLIFSMWSFWEILLYWKEVLMGLKLKVVEKRSHLRHVSIYGFLIFLIEARNGYQSLDSMGTIFERASAIEFLVGCPLFYKTPVSYLRLICEDQSMQTLELRIHTMSSVCPPSWWNRTLKSETAKINKWNPNQKCYSPFGWASKRKDDPSWFDFVSKPHDAFGQLKFQQVIRW